jgi:protein SCO1/2
VAALAPLSSGQVIPKEMPPPVRGLEVANKLGEQVPTSLQFTDQTGKLVSIGDFFNQPAASGGGKGKKPLIVQMMYYRCPILCPTVLSKFTDTLKDVDFTVGKDFNALIVSIDPRDTPKDAVIQQAAQFAAYGRPGDAVRDGWHFLTSTSDSAHKLADAIGFPYRYIPESGEFAHGACMFILTPEGKVARTLTGLNYPSKDVRLALLEASGGKIGTVFDAWTLWCYHWDPNAGGYTLVAMRVMQIGAIATVVLLGSLLLVLWRFDLLKTRRFSLAAKGSSPAAPQSPNPTDVSTPKMSVTRITGPTA